MKTTLERIFWFVIALIAGVIISAGTSSAADSTATPAPAASAAAPAAPAASPAVSPSPSPTPPPPLISGYLDGAAASLSGTGFFTSGVPNRVFDVKRNGLIGHTANLLLQVVPSAGFGGKVELNAGNDANVFASFPNITHQSGFDVTQAYASWTNTPGNFTIIGGKFSTLAGAEVIESPSNLNYSRSILFGYAVPFTHTGFRASFVASPKVTIYAGVNRGWDQTIGYNKTSTLEGALALTPSSTTTLNINGYTGTESSIVVPLATGTTARRNLVDIVAGWKPPGPVAWQLNYDYGTQANAVPVFDVNGNITGSNSASWNGLAGYATYTINPKLSVTARGEYFNDANGYRTGVTQTWNEGTLTLQYTPNSTLLLRGEVRGDNSNQSSFITNTSGKLGKSQTSFAFEAIGKF